MVPRKGIFAITSYNSCSMVIGSERIRRPVAWYTAFTNCSRHNNLTIKRPAWTASENGEKVGEIEQRLTAKDTKRTQHNPASDSWSKPSAFPTSRAADLPR
jgi:hypothetical protein